MSNGIFNSHKVMTTIIPATVATALTLATSTTAFAEITESAVRQYATSMKQAANSKNLNKVSTLVDDDALISMSRRGKTTSLDKSAYLNLLQDSWSKTQNYTYDIQISNIVTSGDQAKADVRTVESWVDGGKKTTLTTSSRATLKSDKNNAVLLRAVSQVTID